MTKTIKELWSTQIRVNPSETCEKIRIIQTKEGGESDPPAPDDEDFLALEAVAGSVVTNLKVGFHDDLYCFNVVLYRLIAAVIGA